MLMMLKDTGELLELQLPEGLWDSYETQLAGCRLAGEEQQELEQFAKQDLTFLSGERLPRCWRDVHYRDEEWQSHQYGSQCRDPSKYGS